MWCVLCCMSAREPDHISPFPPPLIESHPPFDRETHRTTIHLTHKRHKARAEVDAQLASDRAAAKRAVERADQDNSGLNRETLLAVLCELTGHRSSDISDIALDMIWAAALTGTTEDPTTMAATSKGRPMPKQRQGEDATKGDAGTSTEEVSVGTVPSLATRVNAVSAVSRFRYTIERAEQLEKMFKKFDVSKSGGLTPEELKKAITASEVKLEPKRKRWDGTPVVLRPSTRDITYIFHMADADESGTIEQGELVAALSTWQLLAERQMAQRDACCVVL